MDNKIITIKNNEWWFSNRISFFEGTLKKDFYGYIYIIEFKNVYTEFKDIIKIGQSINPFNRFKTFQRASKNYYSLSIDKILLSICHSNYKENEHYLHKHFKNYKIELGELFNMTIDDFILHSPELIFNIN